MFPLWFTAVYLASSCVAGAVSRRDSTGSSNAANCCFSLESASGGPVAENEGGELLLKSESEQGVLCIEWDTRELSDSAGRACYVDHDTHKFQCSSDGTSSYRAFNFANSTSGQTKFLVHEGRPRFLACPASGSETDEGSFNLYSQLKEDQAECTEVLLTMIEGNEQCGGFPEVQMPMYEDESPEAQAETAEGRCDVVQGYNHSMPATRLSTGPLRDMANNQTGYATVDSSSGTFFEFYIGGTWTYHKSSMVPRRCALQFRMPECSQLPDGYPCPSWSGPGQQSSEGSGLRFLKMFDSFDGPNTWWPEELVQVTPGEPAWAGTFDCGVDQDMKNRTITFLATSVNGWSVDFAQAGIGNQEQWMDGVGAYLQTCGGRS